MSYPGLPKMGPVAMEEPENMELLKETAAVYAHVIDKVQAACEPTITQLGYRSLMSQFFADWKTQTYRLLQERAQAPPATVPVARPAAKPEAAKRAHADDAGGDLLLATGEAPAKRPKPEGAGAGAGTGAGAARARYGDDTDDDDDDSSDTDGEGARRREGAESSAEEEGSDAELGPDLDDDDDTNFNDFCQDVADRVMCLYDDVKKTNKKTVLRVSLRDGVIMVRGMPDILFRHITANFKYN